MRVRDARGRFRKQTDEERWPNSIERERMQRIRSYFDLARGAACEALQHSVDDFAFLEGDIWQRR